MKKKKVNEEKVDLLCPICGKFVHTRQIWIEGLKEQRTEFYCQCGWRYD